MCVSKRQCTCVRIYLYFTVCFCFIVDIVQVSICIPLSVLNSEVGCVGS